MSESYSKAKKHSWIWSNTSTEVNVYPTNTQVDTVSNHGVFNADDSFTGTYNPKWRDQIRAGLDATTPASGVKHSFQGDRTIEVFALWVRTNPNVIPLTSSDHSYGIPTYSWPGVATPPSGFVQNVTNQAIRKFLNACQDSSSSVLLGEDIGELKETIHGLRHPFDSLRKYCLTHIRNLKKSFKGYKKTSNSLKKAISDSYLEFTFGWNPIVKDINDAMHGLTHARLPVVPITKSASGTFEGNSQYRISANGATHNGDNVMGTRIVTSRYTVRFKGKMRTGWGMRHPPVWRELRLESADFIPTIWELIPYSFIVDYFTNVGDVISALCFRRHDLLYCCKTVHQRTQSINRVTSFVDPEITTNGRYVSRRWVGGNTDMFTDSFDRSSVSPDSLVPTFTFNVPLSNKPWLNLSFLTLARAENARLARSLGFLEKF